MTNQALDALYEHYPSIIADMKETFTSHDFILHLAHQHQKLYVEALYSYRDYQYQGKPAPFRRVHNALGKRIAHHKDLVTRLDDKKSRDIFKKLQSCAEWKKL